MGVTAVSFSRHFSPLFLLSHIVRAQKSTVKIKTKMLVSKIKTLSEKTVGSLCEWIRAPPGGAECAAAILRSER